MTKTLTILMISIAVYLIAFGTAQAAKGPPNIRNTVHNLSSSAVDNPHYRSANEDEVCIFCHTPHGGSLTGPLWNRNNTTTVYKHYAGANSYVSTLPSTRPVNNESMLCLSCHDGSITVLSILNLSNRTVGLPEDDFTNTVGGRPITAGFFGIGPAGKIGASVNPDGSINDVSTDLMDDHPISFEYMSAVGAKPAEFKIDTAAKAAGVRFFGTNQRVECSSCHDPHVDYETPGNEAWTPFLITPNDGSNLCLACHIK